MNYIKFLKFASVLVILAFTSFSVHAQCAINVDQCPFRTDAENVSLPVAAGRSVSQVVSENTSVVAHNLRVDYDGQDCPFTSENSELPSTLITYDTARAIYPYIQLASGTSASVTVDGENFVVEQTDAGEAANTIVEGSLVSQPVGSSANVMIVADKPMNQIYQFNLPTSDLRTGFKFSDGYDGAMDFSLGWNTSLNAYELRTEGTSRIVSAIPRNPATVWRFEVDYPLVSLYANNSLRFVNIPINTQIDEEPIPTIIYERPAIVQPGTIDRLGQFCGDCDVTATNSSARFHSIMDIEPVGDGSYMLAAQQLKMILNVDANMNFTQYATGVGSINSIVKLGTDDYVFSTNDFMVINRITNGVVSLIAGGGGPNSWPAGSGFADGVGNLAGFNQPVQIALHPDGAIYVADQQSYRIRKVELDGTTTTYAGTGNIFASTKVDGPRLSATFKQPTGIAIDSNGDIFVAEKGSNYDDIRKINYATGIVSTHATGFPTTGKLTIDAQDNLYLYEHGADIIWKITPDGTKSVYAGNGAGDGLGAPTNALFEHVHGLHITADGELLVGDTGNAKLKKVKADQTTVYLAGVSSSSSTFSAGSPTVLSSCDASYNELSEDFTGATGATFTTLNITTSALDADNKISVEVIDVSLSTVRTTKALSTGVNAINIAPLGLDNIRLNFLFDNAGDTNETACVDSYSLDYQ